MNAKLEAARQPVPTMLPARPSRNLERSCTNRGSVRPAATPRRARCAKSYLKALRAAEMASWREPRRDRHGSQPGSQKVAAAFRLTELNRASAVESAVMLFVFLFAVAVIVQHFLASFGSGDLLSKLSQLVQQAIL